MFQIPATDGSNTQRTVLAPTELYKLDTLPMGSEIARSVISGRRNL